MCFLVAQGRTVAETIEISRDVARKLIESHREYGDPCPNPCLPWIQRSSSWMLPWVSDGAADMLHLPIEEHATSFSCRAERQLRPDLNGQDYGQDPIRRTLRR